jgi:hypothetical protein
VKKNIKALHMGKEWSLSLHTKAGDNKAEKKKRVKITSRWYNWIPDQNLNISG